MVLADINASMLKVGRDKLLDSGVAGNVSFVQADAEKLPFPDNHFDCVSIAFGLRNVTHKDAAIRSMAANDRQQKRYSGLKWRLCHAGDASE